MEVVVTRQEQEQEQEHDALHWSRSFKAMEENLCRNYYRNQPARRQLEIPSRRSSLSVHTWSCSSRSSLSTSARTNITGSWIHASPGARAR